MHEPIKTLIEQGLVNGIIGLIGGMARLGTGLSPRDSVWAEVFRLLVIAMPIAWLCGGLVEALASGFIGLIAMLACKAMGLDWRLSNFDEGWGEEAAHKGDPSDSDVLKARDHYKRIRGLI